MKTKSIFIYSMSIAVILLSLSRPTHGEGLVNPDFSDALNGWTWSQSGGSGSPGSVSVSDGQAVMIEGDSFLLTLQQTFNVSDIPSTLSFDIIQNAGLDQTAAFIPDAFEVSLLDADSTPLVAPWKPGATSFFNLQEDGTVHLGSGTTFDGTTVTVDIRSLPPGSEATLIFDFVGSDTDVNGSICVDSVDTLDLEPIAVPVDIKPTSCPNPLSIKKKGVMSVAILGTEGFDVNQVNVATVRLEGVVPKFYAIEDLTTPFVPFTGKMDALHCTEEGPDGFVDLRLKFDQQQVIAVLGAVSDGDVRVLTLTGKLLEQFGRIPIVGEDVVFIRK